MFLPMCILHTCVYTAYMCVCMLVCVCMHMSITDVFVSVGPKETSGVVLNQDLLKPFILSVKTQSSLISWSHLPVGAPVPPGCADSKRTSLPSFTRVLGIQTLLR